MFVVSSVFWRDPRASTVDACDRAWSANQWAEARDRCDGTFQSQAHHVLAARAALSSKQPDVAEEIATSVLAETRMMTSDGADAAEVYGSIELVPAKVEHDVMSVAWATFADVNHRVRGSDLGCARDGYVLAGAWLRLGQFAAGLRALDAAAPCVTRAKYDRFISYFASARGQLLRGAGDLARAEDIAAEAVRAASTPLDLSTALMNVAMIHRDQGHFELARSELERGITAEKAAGSPRPGILGGELLNLADISLEQRRLQEAFAEVIAAQLEDPDAFSLHWMVGKIALAGGDYAHAVRELAAAERIPNESEKWAVAVPAKLAVAEAKLGDDAAAMAADRRAIAEIDREARTIGARPSMASDELRRPYTHLLGLYARHGEWHEVLSLVAQLDSRALLVPRLARIDGTAGDIVGFSPDELVVRWKGRTLVIAISDGEELWRIVVRDGAVSGESLGIAAWPESLAALLARDPTNASAGQTLAAMLVPKDLPDGARLDLMLVGDIGNVPVAALPLAASWQVSRALGLIPSKRPAHLGYGMLVVADPRDDLPKSQAAALEIAGSDARVLARRDATLGRFAASAAGADVLVLAAHSRLQDTQEGIVLADGDLDRRAILALDATPRLVILASCASGVGDIELADGSLANHFVDAGAELVVATRRSVSDTEAAEFLRAFFAADGTADPYHAFAVLQARRVPGWAAFELMSGRPR
ncbi:MAG TPA: CHAT domain-containing protein [Kofleriaceae bacterium]